MEMETVEDSPSRIELDNCKCFKNTDVNNECLQEDTVDFTQILIYNNEIQELEIDEMQQCELNVNYETLQEVHEPSNQREDIEHAVPFETESDKTLDEIDFNKDITTRNQNIRISHGRPTSFDAYQTTESAFLRSWQIRHGITSKLNIFFPF
jgi:hypothetical protein